MDEIASQCGISKKTIYLSFGNKDELVDAVMDEQVQRNSSRCELDNKIATNAIHEIFLSMDMVQEMLGDINPTTISDLQKFHPVSFAKFLKFKESYLYDMIYKNIIWGIQDGLYRSDLNMDIVTRLRLNNMFLPFNQEVFPAAKYSIVEVELQSLEHFLYGLATTKAHKLIIKYTSERLKPTSNERA